MPDANPAGVVGIPGGSESSPAGWPAPRPRIRYHRRAPPRPARDPMPDSPEAYAAHIADIRRDLVAQGVVVREMVERAFDAIFARDLDEARGVIARDDDVDRVDLAVEQSAVDLLVEIARSKCDLGPGPIREILVCVKVNNELERIADAATAPPMVTGGCGRWTGLGQAQLGSNWISSPSKLASSCVHSAFISRTFSRRRSRRWLKARPWLRISSTHQP